MSPEGGWKNNLAVFSPPGGGEGHLPNHHHPPQGKRREREGKSKRSSVQDSTLGLKAVTGRSPVLMCQCCSQSALGVRLSISAR